MDNDEKNRAASQKSVGKRKRLLAVVLALLGIVLVFAKDAEHLGDDNRHAQEFFESIFLPAVIEKLFYEESKCRFTPHYEKFFADCDTNSVASRPRLNFLAEPAPEFDWGIIGLVVKQPGVILALIADTLGIVALPLLLVSVLLGLAAAGNGGGIIMAWLVMFFTMVVLYMVLLLLAIPLFILTWIFGYVFGFLASVWLWCGGTLILIFFFKDLIEAIQRLFEVLRPETPGGTSH